MTTTARTQKTPSAFSLIELLAVITIIALLMGILLPVLGSMRRSAQTATCLSNISTVGHALANFQMRNDDTLPQWSGWHIYNGTPGVNGDEPGLGWTEQLIDSADLPDARVFRDPARPKDFAPFSYFLQARDSYIKIKSIASRSGVDVSEYVPAIQRTTRVKYASAYVLAGDCNSPRLYPGPYGLVKNNIKPDCDQDDATQPAVFVGEKFTGPLGDTTLFEETLDPHRGQTNLLYLDGHVAGAKDYQRGKMTWRARSMEPWTPNKG